MSNPNYTKNDIVFLQNRIVELIKQRDDLLAACELTERAWCGDGVDMATAVDACLLAIEKAK